MNGIRYEVLNYLDERKIQKSLSLNSKSFDDSILVTFILCCALFYQKTFKTLMELIAGIFIKFIYFRVSRLKISFGFARETQKMFIITFFGVLCLLNRFCFIVVFCRVEWFEHFCQSLKYAFR